MRFKAAIYGAAISLGLLGLAGLASGCGKDEGAALIGGQRLDPYTIDRDPLALLPSGVILLSTLDTAALFHSSLGPEVSQIVAGLLPLGPESNFVASRDVTKMVGGMYAMQGVDFCAVFQGTFDERAIRTAAETRAVTLAGVPLIKSRYADMDLFTAGNIGFVILTSHTVVTGNETGIRRALDRLRYGKLERSMPKWMTDLASTQGAAFTLAGDLRGQGAVDAASSSMPFLSGLQTVRVVGNFQPPGVNYAGSLTYSDPARAASGAASLSHLQEVSKVVGLLASWGMGGSVPAMKVAQNGNDAAFTLSLDEGMAKLLLRVAADTAKKALAAK